MLKKSKKHWPKSRMEHHKYKGRTEFMRSAASPFSQTSGGNNCYLNGFHIHGIGEDTRTSMIFEI
ncbi:Uncharacterized protein BM_BM714 [Brugia malayi]|nr:Uncharacterized protein BM_BM714 [Brugia malayi]VIO94702.1 Uncharacterized protein BM_BM714 [Brugia malayi]